VVEILSILAEVDLDLLHALLERAHDLLHGSKAEPTLIARTSAARASTGIVGSSPLLLTGRLRR
jgi:hypothetical protein